MKHRICWQTFVTGKDTSPFGNFCLAMGRRKERGILKDLVRKNRGLGLNPTHFIPSSRGPVWEVWEDFYYFRTLPVLSVTL